MHFVAFHKSAVYTFKNSPIFMYCCMRKKLNYNLFCLYTKFLLTSWKGGGGLTARPLPLPPYKFNKILTDFDMNFTTIKVTSYVMHIFYRGKVKVKIRPRITIGGRVGRLWVETAQADLIPESIKKFDKQGRMPVTCSTGNKSWILYFDRTCLNNKNDNNFP